jgi:hypothetical protein
MAGLEAVFFKLPQSVNAREVGEKVVERNSFRLA